MGLSDPSLPGRQAMKELRMGSQGLAACDASLHAPALPFPSEPSTGLGTARPREARVGRRAARSWTIATAPSIPFFAAALAES